METTKRDWQKWENVQSSNIDKVAYLLTSKIQGTGVLVVTFKNQKKYRYENVPESIVHEMMNSESIGKAFSKLIRPDYHGTIVTKYTKNEKRR